MILQQVATAHHLCLGEGYESQRQQAGGSAAELSTGLQGLVPWHVFQVEEDELVGFPFSCP